MIDSLIARMIESHATRDRLTRMPTQQGRALDRDGGLGAMSAQLLWSERAHLG
jgi:hypothetical protein